MMHSNLCLQNMFQVILLGEEGMCSRATDNLGSKVDGPVEIDMLRRDILPVCLRRWVPRQGFDRLVLWRHPGCKNKLVGFSCKMRCIVAQAVGFLLYPYTLYIYCAAS